MITVVLADDHHVVRQGLRLLLEAEPDLQVVGETADGLETVRLIENVRPDILVLDLMMGGINGLEVARQVNKHSPTTGIIILSMYSNEAYVLEALRAGAKAYVLKESTAGELVKAVRAAAAGHHYLSSSLSERAVEAYVEKSKDAVLDSYDTLTTREREVLHLAAQGCTNADIATRLYISRRTVEAHRANMMQKLGLRTQSQLVNYAIRRGILPPDNEPPLYRS
jgi:DNA-binding NarL/FixJ family response regulator